MIDSRRVVGHTLSSSDKDSEALFEIIIYKKFLNYFISLLNTSYIAEKGKHFSTSLQIMGTLSCWNTSIYKCHFNCK